MITLSEDDRRHAFAVWLRTGKLPRARNANGLELKFNPYHDPRDGRFTFATSGSLATGGAEAGYARKRSLASRHYENESGKDRVMPESKPVVFGSTPVLKLAGEGRLAPSAPEPVVGRGGNFRAFEDPMTLEPFFPGLGDSPGGAIVAVADNLFDFRGPANAMAIEVLQDQAKQLSSQIKEIDPSWHYDEIIPTDALKRPTYTVQGLTAKVNDLRFQRAAVFARLRSDYEPLQVETLRFIQQRADDAYDQGIALLRAGRLRPRLSDREAVGNYIDQQVRLTLRERYNRLGIDAAGTGPVRVNRRENSSDTDLTYRRPDARVKDVAFDVTLTRKTLGTPQVRGFFGAGFRPSRVIIIRPRQLGSDHTYVILRPSEMKR